MLPNQREPMQKELFENEALERELFDVAEELYEFLSDAPASRIHDDRCQEKWKNRSEALNDQVSQICSLLGEKKCQKEGQIHQSLNQLAKGLQSYSHQIAVHSLPLEESLQEDVKTLSQAYEELIFHLQRKKNAGVIRRLKPKNYLRNLFHVVMATSGALLYEFVLSFEQAAFILISILSVFFFLEVTRRFSKRWNDFLVDRLFFVIARPGERYRTNSGFYYVLALVLLIFLFPSPAVIMGILILGFGDPAAAIVGKNFGKTKIYCEKSLEGSLGFLLVSFAVGLPYLFWRTPLGLLDATLCALSAAFVGALTELVSEKVDDNLTIPLAVGFVVFLWV
jgi:dolichol kinase